MDELTIEYRDGKTVVSDEEGTVLFVLSGGCSNELCLQVFNIIGQAFERGEKFGRDALAYDLRKLLGAAEQE